MAAKRKARSSKKSSRSKSPCERACKSKPGSKRITCVRRCRVGKKVNVEEMNRKHPKTYKIGSRAVRASIPVGNLAKVVWECPDGGDRMWVEITKRTGKGSKVRYVGRLRNDGINCGPAWGALVKFGPEHIADRMSPRWGGEDTAGPTRKERSGSKKWWEVWR
jgi:hypothetical protein